MKHLQKILGERTREVIDYALNNWWKFAVRAGAESGGPFPTSPHIGFLLKHCNVAVDLLDPKAKAQVTPFQPIAAAHPVPMKPTELPDDEKPHELTQEELDEMLAGLNQ